MKACMGHRGIAPPFLNLDTRLRSAENLKPSPFYLPYPLFRRVGVSRSRSRRFEEEKNLLPMWGLEHTIVELAVGKEYFYFNLYGFRSDSVNFI
jgi:hypothetical protein